jgi:hypothetical protein
LTVFRAIKAKNIIGHCVNISHIFCSENGLFSKKSNFTEFSWVTLIFFRKTDNEFSFRTSKCLFPAIFILIGVYQLSAIYQSQILTLNNFKILLRFLEHPNIRVSYKFYGINHSKQKSLSQIFLDILFRASISLKLNCIGIKKNLDNKVFFFFNFKFHLIS